MKVELERKKKERENVDRENVEFVWFEESEVRDREWLEEMMKSLEEEMRELYMELWRKERERDLSLIHI